MEEYHIAEGENPATPESGQLLTAAVQKNVGGGGFEGVEGVRCQGEGGGCEVPGGGCEVPGGGWRVGGSGAISVCSYHLPTRSVYMSCRIKNHWVIDYSNFNYY